jgi:NitT/TauT family transport system substrate-binding protein
VAKERLTHADTFKPTEPWIEADVDLDRPETRVRVNGFERRAARFYLDESKDKMSIEDITQILLAPDYIFDQTPRGVGDALRTMYKAGIIKTEPQSWKDVYFPEVRQLPGS